MSSEILKISDDITSAYIEILHHEVNALLEEGIVDITFDLSDVDIVDSTGVGFIIRVQNSLKQKSGGLVLSGVNSDILKMMKIMRLDRHFSIKE